MLGWWLGFVCCVYCLVLQHLGTQSEPGAGLDNRLCRLAQCQQAQLLLPVAWACCDVCSAVVLFWGIPFYFEGSKMVAAAG